jgi:hypothetical protein
LYILTIVLSAVLLINRNKVRKKSFYRHTFPKIKSLYDVSFKIQNKTVFHHISYNIIAFMNYYSLHIFCSFFKLCDPIYKYKIALIYDGHWLSIYIIINHNTFIYFPIALYNFFSTNKNRKHPF